MKPIFLILVSLGVLLNSCKEEKEVKPLDRPALVEVPLKIPDITVDYLELDYNNKVSLWTLEDQLYSGYAVSYYEEDMLKEKIGFLEGRKQNQAIQWYPDGHYKQVANYYAGKLHGGKKLWSAEPDHFLVAHLNYQRGKAHGEQKKWYPTGELFKVLNLKEGREEGIQQAYRKNGALFANYEAKEGRIFGLKKAALCFGLEDGDVQYQAND